MSAPSGTDKPVVEAAPHGGDAPDLTLRALRQRIRQQEILAELGVSALQGATLDTLLSDTVRLAAQSQLAQARLKNDNQALARAQEAERAVAADARSAAQRVADLSTQLENNNFATPSELARRDSAQKTATSSASARTSRRSFTKSSASSARRCSAI